MPFQRTRQPLALSASDVQKLDQLASSRSEPFAKVQRARCLLAYHQGQSLRRISRELQVTLPALQRTIDRALAGGVEAGLCDIRRPGRSETITDEARAWVINLACTKPREHGLAAETWTYRELAKYIRSKAIEAGYDCLSRVSESKLHTLLKKAGIKLGKVSYYCERRDPDFEAKMAQILCVYKEVQILNAKIEQGLAQERASTTISYDEKPGIQAIGSTAKDLMPVAERHSCIARDYEYKRYGTVSFLAGIDLHSGRVIGLVRDKHRSEEFIEFLEATDKEYPASWRIRIILDNHSTHVSKKVMEWLKNKPNRFEFVHTPKHGSWLNIVEAFFSKMTRSFLRDLRVGSKAELKQRIEQYLGEINADPIIFRWKYKMDEVSVV